MVAIDENASSAEGLSSPADDGFAITVHDTNELSYVTRGIYVGVSGTVKLVTKKGTTLEFKGAVAGSVIPVRAKKVLSTGTTATDLIGLI